MMDWSRLRETLVDMRHKRAMLDEAIITLEEVVVILDARRWEEIVEELRED